MQTCHSIDDMRARLQRWRQAGETIVLVPTMGNLHAGHLALVDHARRPGARVVATIFINPMQFDREDDLAAYPRTLQADSEQLEAHGTDLLFAPEASSIYPESLDKMTRVTVPVISERMEGGSRAGHFTGVATVVSKLFNLIQPDVAVFGEKDYQQLLVIRKMVADMNLPVEIESVATVREKDGLAMSSRNGYLTAEERQIAAVLHKTLLFARDALLGGKMNYSQIEAESAARLDDAGFTPDYFEICHAKTLLPAEKDDKTLIILAAAWLGKARLIDNLPVNLTSTGPD